MAGARHLWRLDGATRTGGNGHVNRRNNAWVAERFGKMGYVHDVDEQRTLWRAVSDIHWYRYTIMVFRKRKAKRLGFGRTPSPFL